MSMTLGKNVRALRLAKGWDLEALSKRSGVKVGTISAIEVRESIRSQFAAQLAAALDVPLEQLIADKPVTQMIATSEGEIPPKVSTGETRNVTALPVTAPRRIADTLTELQTALESLSPLLRDAGLNVLQKWLNGQASAAEAASVIEQLQQISTGTTSAAENRAA